MTVDYEVARGDYFVDYKGNMGLMTLLIMRRAWRVMTLLIMKENGVMSVDGEGARGITSLGDQGVMTLRGM